MGHDPDLDNLFIEILIANENPITQDELCNTVKNNGLFDFSESSVNEGDLSAYVWQYFDFAINVYPDHMVRLPNNQYVYTPRKDLLPITGESIRLVHLKNLPVQEIIKTLDSKDANQIALLLSLRIALEKDISKYLIVSDARIRYAVLFDMVEMESDEAKKEDLILQGLKDANKKINTAAIGYVTASSSREILLKICDLMEDDVIYRTAQLKSYECNDEKIYAKYLELAKDEDFELARLPADLLLLAEYAIAIPFQFKILENWEDYKENYKRLGFTQIEVEDRITGLANRYIRLPRLVKDDLIKYCHSTDLNIQNKAMQCLEGKWAKSEFKLIESIVTTDNPLSRKLQIKEMARLNASKSLSAAVELIKDPDQFVRNAAIEVVGEHGSEVELLILLDIFKDQAKQDQFDITTLLEAIKKLQGR